MIGAPIEIIQKKISKPQRLSVSAFYIKFPAYTFKLRMFFFDFYPLNLDRSK
jgi:hypothetical protein